MLAIELSGEHDALPAEEALAVLEAWGPVRVVRREPPLLVVESAAPAEAVATRLALAWSVGDVAGTVEPTPEAVAAVPLKLPDGPYAVRATRLGAQAPELTRQLEQALGAALSGPGRWVRLRGQAHQVRLLVGRDAVVVNPAHPVDRRRFEARHQARKHRMPISIHPRLARAMVNLARAGPNERVWDPFCGTGGHLLEAALAGCHAVGSDASEAMARRARATLRRFELAGDILQGDFEHVGAALGSVDAVVTDPPYGRASTTRGESVESLYARMFRAVADVLPAGRHACVIVPRPMLLDFVPPELEIRTVCAARVHSSLTRHVTVLRRR